MKSGASSAGAAAAENWKTHFCFCPLHVAFSLCPTSSSYTVLWFMVAIHLRAASITSSLLGDHGSSCVFWEGFGHPTPQSWFFTLHLVLWPKVSTFNSKNKKKATPEAVLWFRLALFGSSFWLKSLDLSQSVFFLSSRVNILLKLLVMRKKTLHTCLPCCGTATISLWESQLASRSTENEGRLDQSSLIQLWKH